MNRVELEGVLAHELSHIKNYDILVSTLAVTMVGVIAIAADIGDPLHVVRHGAQPQQLQRRRRGRRSTAILAIFGFALLILSPLIGRAMQAAVSRRRETLADVSGVELTRYPPGLISALEKLRDDYTVVGSTSHATAHLWIEQPQAVEEDEGRISRINRMFDTHPPLEERIALSGSSDPPRSASPPCWTPRSSGSSPGGRRPSCWSGASPSRSPAAVATTRRPRPPRPPPRRPRPPRPRRSRSRRSPGCPASYGDRLERTALVVKIDNGEPKARPQVGINQADVVYEERVEGSVTRLLAIFHSTDSVPVGPVRSARTSDIAIFTPLHHPYFAWSGANPTFARRIRDAAALDVGYDALSGEYFREPSRSAPSNLMLKSTATIMALPNEGSAPPPPLFQYRAPGQAVAHLEPVAGADGAASAPAAAARPPSGAGTASGWARTQKGTPHVDAAGVQVAPGQRGHPVRRVRAHATWPTSSASRSRRRR